MTCVEAANAIAKGEFTPVASGVVLRRGRAVHDADFAELSSRQVIKIIATLVAKIQILELRLQSEKAK